jgi:hypothetical protein
VQKESRGTVYNQVRCNGKELGFTDALGKHWPLWQAFRELLSNALDENGNVKRGQTAYGLPGQTIITVEGPEIEQVYNTRGIFFLSGREPLESADGISIYTGQGIYYRGILVSPEKTAFAYNLEHGVRLTEDRTIANVWDVQYAIAYWLTHHAKPSRLIRAMGTDFVEQKYTFPSTISEAARETIVKLADQEKLPSSMQGYANDLRKIEGEYPTREPTPSESKLLTEAIKILAGIGSEVDPGAIHISDRLPNDVLGLQARGKIFLSGSLFPSGLTRVVGTLFEEHQHLAGGYADCTRRFQNFLIDTIATLALEKSTR